jgi:membrane protein YdbS with pleckstrin-like domain
VTTASTDAAQAGDDYGRPGERRLDPRLRTVWTIETAIAFGVVLLVVVAGGVGLALAGLDALVPTVLVAAAVVAVGGLLTWWWPAANWRSWRFELAGDALELRHGILLHTHSAIPYGRVQYIDIKQGPVERALGLARLVVHTAAAASDAELPGIPAAEAEGLRRTLLERAGVGDAV